MELLSEEDVCCSVGEHWRELGCFDDFHHLSPGHGPLSGWDAGLIFDQNIFPRAMSVVLVVTETEHSNHPESSGRKTGPLLANIMGLGFHARIRSTKAGFGHSVVQVKQEYGGISYIV